jgi:hypothetical protein
MLFKGQVPRNPFLIRYRVRAGNDDSTDLSRRNSRETQFFRAGKKQEIK